ncbi:MAG: LemA family protein [Candidatus Micrarchaeia archaeon]|jgi:LemA protein
MIWLIIIAAIVLVLLVVVYYINKIQILSNQIENSWAQIEVQLQRRAELIPNLVNTVKGYAKHEREVFENVTNARSQLLKASGRAEKIRASDQLTTALKSLFAVAENYPELKANQNFLALQEELTNTENKIAYARQFYNDAVLSYNNIITTIPGMWFAFGRKPKEYLEAPKGEEAPPKVEF